MNMLFPIISLPPFIFNYAVPLNELTFLSCVTPPVGTCTRSGTTNKVTMITVAIAAVQPVWTGASLLAGPPLE